MRWRNEQAAREKDMKRQLVAFVMLLGLAACGGAGGEKSQDAAASDAQAAQERARAARDAEPKLPSCPFNKTREWMASIRGGRLLVTGTVDLMIAGFKPVLTPREETGGTAAFDLALVGDPTAAVNQYARFEKNGTASYQRVTVYCGGKQIASVPVIHVG
jgi:hypothetical protein